MGRKAVMALFHTTQRTTRNNAAKHPAEDPKKGVVYGGMSKPKPPKKKLVGLV